jgi:hypothetical protein
LEYLMAIWYNLWPFGIACGHLLCFSQFGMFGPRKIWQPWYLHKIQMILVILFHSLNDIFYQSKVASHLHLNYKACAHCQQLCLRENCNLFFNTCMYSIHIHCQIGMLQPTILYCFVEPSLHILSIRWYGEGWHFVLSGEQNNMHRYVSYF